MSSSTSTSTATATASTAITLNSLNSKFICLILDYIDDYNHLSNLVFFDKELMLKTAAEHNCINILKYFMSVGCSILWGRYTRHTVEVIAAEKGNLEFLKLISEHFRINIDTISCASEYGHLHIVQWAFNSKFDICNEEVIHLACKNGHIDILEWGYDNWYNWDNSIFQLIGIFDGARGAAIKWLRDKDLIDDTFMEKCLMRERMHKEDHEYFCLMMNR
jgi:hypothetical protein